MKKVILSALLIASSAALVACAPGKPVSSVDSAAPVFEKKVTK